MKSLSMKNASMRKSSFKMMDCFDTNATVSSIMYSRCLLYIVLFFSLINLFYIINLRNTYSLVIFFLVGFITSFFVKNMIIIILFATFVSLFFQSITYQKAHEGFSEDVDADAIENYDHPERDADPAEVDTEFSDVVMDSGAANVTKAAQKKSHDDSDKAKGKKGDDDAPMTKGKMGYDGAPPAKGKKGSDDLTMAKRKMGYDGAPAAKGKKGGDVDAAKSDVTSLKQNMDEYYTVQKELLELLEKAEPLQQRANIIKEKFNSMSDSKEK